MRLDEAGHADAALRDRGLALAVTRHKTMLFAEKDGEGLPVDYAAAVTRAIRLVLEGKPREALADDYRRMHGRNGLLLDDIEAFDVPTPTIRQLTASRRHQLPA